MASSLRHNKRSRMLILFLGIVLTLTLTIPLCFGASDAQALGNCLTHPIVSLSIEEMDLSNSRIVDADLLSPLQIVVADHEGGIYLVDLGDNSAQHVARVEEGSFKKLEAKNAQSFFISHAMNGTCNYRCMTTDGEVLWELSIDGGSHLIAYDGKYLFTTAESANECGEILIISDSGAIMRRLETMGSSVYPRLLMTPSGLIILDDQAPYIIEQRNDEYNLELWNSSYLGNSSRYGTFDPSGRLILMTDAWRRIVILGPGDTEREELDISQWADENFWPAFLASNGETIAIASGNTLLKYNDRHIEEWMEWPDIDLAREIHWLLVGPRCETYMIIMDDRIITQDTGFQGISLEAAPSTPIMLNAGRDAVFFGNDEGQLVIIKLNAA